MNQMPSDWWPDMVTVRGSAKKGDQQFELCFALMAEDLALGRIDLLKLKLMGLRVALWQELQK